MFYIVGLGNPGKEYEGTRHNAGRAAVAGLEIRGGEVIVPDTFMNKSGDALKNFQFSVFNFQTDGKKKERGIKNLVLVHDDLDLPLGSFKISFNKSSGGHKGVESVIKALKTQAFVRIRIGISKPGARGKLTKPDILGKFTLVERKALAGVYKKIHAALVVLVSDGREKTMSEFN